MYKYSLRQFDEINSFSETPFYFIENEIIADILPKPSIKWNVKFSDGEIIPIDCATIHACHYNESNSRITMCCVYLVSIMEK